MQFHGFSIYPVILCIAGLLITGCGGGAPNDTPELGAVKGKVTLDGEPLDNATVAFLSADGKAASGSTNATGEYELIYRDGLMGAAIGSNTVQITTVLDAPPPPGYKDPIPAKYNEQSTLTAEVKAGENVINFELAK